MLLIVSMVTIYHQRVDALKRYSVPVFNVPERFFVERMALGFDRVDYGVGGIELFRPEDLTQGQVGYSVTPEGKSLIGDGDGDWHSDWLVIAYETACGDPIFLSTEPPYPVFTAMHGEGRWDAKLVAPTLDTFWKCLDLFRNLARDRAYPVQLAGNPPGTRRSLLIWSICIDCSMATRTRLTSGLCARRSGWMMTRPTDRNDTRHSIPGRRSRR